MARDRRGIDAMAHADGAAGRLAIEPDARGIDPMGTATPSRAGG
jgi:hypothetical protein